MKTVSISLSPNTEKDDISLAFKELFSSKKVEGKDIEKFENIFNDCFKFDKVFSLNSGRSSLIVILEALGIQKNDEIIVQAYTCNAVINPILKLEAFPVYVDIDDNLNIDPSLIEEKITNKTKAVIVQHTFGMPAQLDKIKEICIKHNIFLIEDCAHALLAKYKEDYCGKFGDVSFFSFGRDKVISSVYGGMIGSNDKELSVKIENVYNKLDFPDKKWVNKQIRHPILMNLLILPFYNFLNIGKIILELSIRSETLSKAVCSIEYQGELPDYFPKKMPNSLAKMALNQFKKIEKFNNHRRELAKYYKKEIGGIFNINEDAIYLKFPIKVNNGDAIIKEFSKYNIMLEDGWRKKVIVPPKTNLIKMHYNIGECKKAEEFSDKMLILPTHINISMETAERIVYILKSLI
ncbi:MAG: aminotransferase class V-fold PLP-dependent enzyme [Candidatus Pacebacteria bacterium]|nr:aminotransferase class V-fold PLP-dependent enzyme [Candidatus Paceibacterota bacterium]